MLKNVILSLLFLFSFYSIYLIAGENSGENAVLGNWEDIDPVYGTSVINIYKDGNKFFGKIIKMKNEAELDENNPDITKRELPVLNSVILKNFKYNENEWADGTVYDPKNGKTYSCKIWLENPDTLKLRGFIGISLLGRTQIWYREKENNNISGQ